MAEVVGAEETTGAGCVGAETSVSGAEQISAGAEWASADGTFEASAAEMAEVVDAECVGAEETTGAGCVGAETSVSGAEQISAGAEWASADGTFEALANVAAATSVSATDT